MPVSLKVSRVGSLEDSKANISLEAIESTTIPLQIFLHKVDDRGESYDSFVSICSVEDLDRFPSSRAGVTKGSLYRRSSAKIQFTSALMASKGKEDIEYSLRDLVSEYTKALEVTDLNDTLEL